MKYPQSQFELLVAGLKVVVPYYRITKETPLTIGLIHDLHFRVYINYTYSDQHPNVNIGIDGKRILPLTESFELYPINCHDDQIETAMKKALKLVF